MKLERKISILGGDLRIINLAKMLCEDGFEVKTYALEKAGDLKEVPQITACHSLEQCVKSSEVIVTSIPLSKDGIFVSTPYSDIKLEIATVQQNCKGKKLISGKLNEAFQKDETIDCYDLLEYEEYAVLNAIATAEGAIQIAMEEYPRTLSGANILVMGFGRIGKIVSKMLQGIRS